MAQGFRPAGSNSPRWRLPAWLGMFAVLWWIVTQGDNGSWLIGIPTVIAAALAAVWLGDASPPAIRLTALLAFLRFFITESIRGGTDVARRALQRDLPLAPGLVECRLRLPAGRGRSLLTATLNLLPGTLVVETRAKTLRLHVVDTAGDAQAEVDRAESRIAALLGVNLAEEAGTS